MKTQYSFPVQEPAEGDSKYPNSIEFSRQISFQDIRAHLTGPVVSVCAHIIMLGFLCSIFVPAEPKKEYMEFTVTPMKIVEPPPIEKPDIPELEPVEPPDTPVDRDSDAQSSMENDPVINSGDAANGPVSDIEVPQIPNSPGIIDAVSVISIPVPPGSPLSWRNKQGIKDILEDNDATKTDPHVTGALNWLKEHQNSDGSWGEDKGRQPALTGLATLTFLGRGTTPMSQDYGKTLVMALKKLVEFGGNTSADGVISGDGNAYGHPIVAYALSEAYTLTKIPQVEEVMNKMMHVIVRGQNKNGSFNYRYNNAPDQKTGEPRNDLSYAGWNYQALKAAFTAGSNVPGIETAMKNAVTAIEKTHAARDGSFSYGIGGDRGSISMTSVGTLCLQLLDHGKNPYMEKGLRWLVGANNGRYLDGGWKENSGNAWALYTWYYQTQALYQGSRDKGDAWKKWDDKFLKGVLAREQERDGHWTSPYEKYGPSRNGQGHGEGTGSVFKDSPLDLYIYSTSLCCLMLEVYYRYLPTFKMTSLEGKANPVQMQQEDRISIE